MLEKNSFKSFEEAYAAVESAREKIRNTRYIAINATDAERTAAAQQKSEDEQKLQDLIQNSGFEDQIEAADTEKKVANLTKTILSAREGLKTALSPREKGEATSSLESALELYKGLTGKDFPPEENLKSLESSEVQELTLAIENAKEQLPLLSGRDYSEAQGIITNAKKHYLELTGNEYPEQPEESISQEQRIAEIQTRIAELNETIKTAEFVRDLREAESELGDLQAELADLS